ncbi:MAG: amidase [Pseudomonadota bacterium]
MADLTRRHLLAGGAAIGALAACSPVRDLDADDRIIATNASDDSGESGKFIDGVAMAALIRSGEMTASEAVEQAILRSERLNPQINAIATKSYDQARQSAIARPQGPFGGVPTFIKDLETTAGVKTMYGSRGFSEFVSPADGEVATFWKAGGTVSLGKSTTPEMGLTASTEPLVTGITRNPWNLNRIPGGSSGGAAALTAARVVPFAHASDGGGSIRIPASCCGLFGLKPSRGRVGQIARAGRPIDISVHHTVTWTVRDSAALFAMAETGVYDRLGVISGPSSDRLRIGFAPEPMNGSALHPDVLAVAEETAVLCESLGHEIVEADLSFDLARFTDAFTLLWAAAAAEFAQAASRMSGQPIGPDIVEPLTLWLAAYFQARADQMPEAIGYLQAFEDQYTSFFDGFDVLLQPTLTTPPVEVGVFNPAGDAEAVFAAVSDFVGYTPPMNVAGAPSMSVPLGMSSDGLPIGMMFSGAPGQDARLIHLAYELEAAAPWINRVPPVSA